MQHKQMIASLGSLLSLFSLVHSHGYVSSPRARNWVAHENGTDGQEAGKAKKEYCPHCLNRNNGVCGYTDTNDYDEWVDSLGNVIPWESQGAYNSGDVIRMNFTIPVHHGGHIEIRACPNGRSSTWDCFTDPSRSLLFVKDLLYDIPADPIHPDRGYLAGWSEGYTEYVHDYQLPQGLYGEEVLIQWKYITSNSCKPPNYDAYFSGGNSQVKVLPSEWYSPTVSDCNLPYPQSGDPSLPGTPEQFLVVLKSLSRLPSKYGVRFAGTNTSFCSSGTTYRYGGAADRTSKSSYTADSSSDRTNRRISRSDFRCKAGRFKNDGILGYLFCLVLYTSTLERSFS